jgi:hypothetical protein
MSSLDSNKLVTDLQAIHDQQIARSFNNPSSHQFPQVGSVVLRLVGFGVVTIVGFNFEEGKIGNITINDALPTP